MSEFLLLLGKVNLAMGFGIVLVWLLRRPVRAQLGAAMAYALWLLVPVAGLASLLPPRMEAPVVQVMAAPAATNFSAPVANNFAAPLPAPAPVVSHVLAEKQNSAPRPSVMARLQSLDYVPLLFAGWLLGVGGMALYLAWLQMRFYAVARAGGAGPAVAGFWRPRLVMPRDFETQFTAGEQAAILAHERVHLRRQDARINALAALLRALCWFNPLMHLADRWLRIDQELACDAGAMAAQVSRRDYARALLKSQMSQARLPLGCNWPGSEHPLVERIALLKRKRPGRAKRVAGVGFVMLAAASAGLSAWAAQPAVPGKVVVVVAARKQVARAAPAIAGTSGQEAVITPPADTKTAQALPIPEPAVATNKGGTQKQAPVLEENRPQQKIEMALKAMAGAALALAAADASASLPDESIAREMAANAATPAILATKAPPGPGPRSAAGIACMVGLGPEDCKKVFEDPTSHDYSQCAKIDARTKPEGCPYGALESVTYLGTNDVGDEVYGVAWMQLLSTFILPPPGPNGKIGHGPWRRTAVDLRVSAPAQPAVVLYTRPSLEEPSDQAIPYSAGAPRGFSLAGDVRSQIAQPLQQAVQLVRKADRDRASIIALFNRAAAVPGLNGDEVNAVAQARVILFGSAQVAGPAGFGVVPFQETFRTSIPVSSYLPHGDSGPNNPN